MNTGDEGDPSANHPPTPSPSPSPLTPAPTTSTRKRSKRSLPEDWAPSDKHRDQARAKGLDVDSLAFRFRNWAQANDARYVDWDATFRNWIDKEKTSPGAPAQRQRPGRAPRMSDYSSEEWLQLPIEQRAAIAQRGQM